MYVQTDETGRIRCTVELSEYTDDSYFEFNFPEDFDVSKQLEYRIEEKELIHDPLPPSEEELEAQKEFKRKSQMETAVTLFVRTASLDDDTALTVSELYPEWSGDSVKYKAKERLRYGDALYNVLQDHTSQPTWTPDSTPSLYSKVLPGQQGEIGEWVQPDSTNPYKKGDKVTHNGKTWESMVDNNVWEPGAVGTESLWKEVI